MTTKRPANKPSDLTAGDLNVGKLADEIFKGDRRALSKAITLTESTRADHRVKAEKLLEHLMDHTGKALRIGLTGAPGVGKSTFTEAFGRYLTAQGLKLAVLAIDPSSARSGGSILGDKTRMEELSRDPNAFIRPSPSGGSLGGVARRTRESLLLMEAAGFDVVIVETVGVGQSETMVADMVDFFLLLLSPAGGDELQGIKRGIMELADLVVVNKADGDLIQAAQLSAAQCKSALSLMRPKTQDWTAEILTASSLQAKGMAEIWERIGAHRKIFEKSGRLKELRAGQARAWLWRELEEGLTAAFRAQPEIAEKLRKFERAVGSGKMAPTVAARALLSLFSGSDERF